MPKNASKIEYYGEILIDLTGDSVEADNLVIGITAHDKTGVQIVGTNPYEKNTTDAAINNALKAISEKGVSIPDDAGVQDLEELIKIIPMNREIDSERNWNLILTTDIHITDEETNEIIIEQDENDSEFAYGELTVILQGSELIDGTVVVLVKFSGMDEYIQMCIFQYMDSVSLHVIPEIYWGCEIIPFEGSGEYSRSLSVLPDTGQNITGVKLIGVRKANMEIWGK